MKIIALKNIVLLIACAVLIIYMTSSSISYRQNLSNMKVEQNISIGGICSKLIAPIINGDNNIKIQDLKNTQYLKIIDRFTTNSDVDTLVSALTKLFPTENIKIRLYDDKGILVIESNKKKEIYAVVNKTPKHFGNKLFIGIHQLVNKFINYQNEVLFKQIESIYDEDVLLRETIYPEVESALSGHMGAVIRYDSDGNNIINVAMPLHSSNNVKGVFLITDKDNQIYVDFIRIEFYRLCLVFIFIFVIIVIIYLIKK